MSTEITLTSAQISTLQSLINQGQYPGAYAYLRDILNATPTADPNLARWFDVAWRVNMDDGTVFSELVREATITAGAILGKPITRAEFQEQSNRLARSVLEGIIQEGQIPVFEKYFCKTLQQQSMVSDCRCMHGQALSRRHYLLR